MLVVLAIPAMPVALAILMVLATLYI